jgi:hypothetical protein
MILGRTGARDAGRARKASPPGRGISQFWRRALDASVPLIDNVAYAMLSILGGLTPFTIAEIGTRDVASHGCTRDGAPCSAPAGDHAAPAAPRSPDCRSWGTISRSDV